MNHDSTILSDETNPNPSGVTKREKKSRVLVYGYLPPPSFGPSTVYTTLASAGAYDAFSTTFVDLSVVDAVAELGRMNLRKLFRFVELIIVTWRACRSGQDLCCYPISYGSIAVVKDFVLLGIVRAHQIPVLLFAHGFGLQNTLRSESRLISALLRRTVVRSTGALVLGETLRKEFDSLIPPARLHVMPLGVGVPEPLPGRTRSAERVRVLFLSNLIPEKGVFVLLDAALALIQEKLNLELVLAGRAWNEETTDRLTRYINDARFNGRLRVVPGVDGDEKWRELVDADIVAFPTYYSRETFGLVLLEAMACGKPVISTRRGAIPEVFVDGAHGLFVSERDSDDLASKLRELIADVAKRDRMGAAAAVHYRNNFTASRFSERFTSALKRFLPHDGVNGS